MMGCRDDATKVHRVYFTSCPIAFGKWIANIKKSHCTICTTALWRGKCRKCRKCKAKKWHKNCENSEKSHFSLCKFLYKQLKWKRIFLSVQNYQKWFKNFDIFHKRHKGNKGARLQKMYVRLWDFGTLKSHSLKVFLNA